MLVLTESDVRRAMAMGEAIETARIAYRAIASGEAQVPPRAVLRPHGGGVGLVMPAYVPSVGGYGVKFVSVVPGNRQRGLPATVGALLLVDPATGVPLALMDGTFLTALRTGAGTGAATDALARPDARTLALIGTGSQADAQLEAVLQVRPIERALVCSRSFARAEAFCRRHDGRPNGQGRPVRCEPVARPEAAVREADIVVAVTDSPRPVVEGAWLRPGAHVNAVGSHDEFVHELDEAVLTRAALIAVDSRPGAVLSADLAVPLRRGLIQEDQLMEIGRIIAGDHPGRRSPDHITVFKSVGHASQDMVIATWIYARARELGLGQLVPLRTDSRSDS